MPNIITHALCAQDALSTIENLRLKQLILKHPQVFSMASSGPDFIFYYHTFPWQDQSRCHEVYQVGNLVHSSHINDFYLKALDLIQQEQDPHIKEIQTVFLAGHLMHWSLDSSAHPFVFFHTGEMKGATKYWHYRFESMLDTLMVQKIKKFKLSETKSYEMVFSTQETQTIIAEFYEAIVTSVYGVSLGKGIYIECLQSMNTVSKLLFDPHQTKLPLIQLLEKQMKMPWKFSSHMILGKNDETHDILNLKHKIWNHPTDVNLTSNESFLDLYQKAVLRAQACLYSLEGILSNKLKYDSLVLILQDRNYDTGLANPGPMFSYRPMYGEGE